MAPRVKNEIERYFQQQLDLGYDEVYLPIATRPVGKKKVKPLPLERFTECETLEQLEKTVCICRKCPLWETRTNYVFGTGSPHAELMFVGEAPGRDEDLQGEPFVGRAGKLLDRMLAGVGLRREDVYITNVLKCRPPNNRDPLPDEVEECEPFLLMQIKLIRPKIICALGRIAAQTLLKTNLTLGAMRARWFDYKGIKLTVTYHPAAILRTDSYRQPAMDDLLRVVNELKKTSKQK